MVCLSEPRESCCSYPPSNPNLATEILTCGGGGRPGKPTYICDQTGLVLTTLWALQRGSRDGWAITAGHDRCQRKHVRHPALAEANDLHVDLGLSVEQ
jgi:hypothetical protein